MKRTIWLSYDLGIKGDYPGLYKWLDSHKAKECGNSIAYLNYEYKSELLPELLEDIKTNIDFKSGDRIYLIANVSNESGTQKVSGTFIIGNRKASPWEGYAPVEDNVSDF
jgi:hypothetical protein